MKNKYFLLTLVLAATAFMATSCQKEEGTVTLGAEIQRPTNGKVYINDHTPCWHNGDEVYINNAAYAVIAATGSSAQIEQVTRHDTYRAIFPAGIVASGSNISNSASVPVTLPAVQQYQMVGSHQRVDVPMGAYLTSGSTLHFYNLCSIVRVMVSNSLNQDLSLSSIVLQTEQARLSGSGTAVVNGSASNAIAMASTASHQVALNFTEDYPATVDALGTATFDIVVPAFTTDDVTIRIFTNDGNYFETTKNNVGLVHNTITTVTVNVTEFTTPPYSSNLIDGPTFNSRIPSSAREVVFEYGSIVSTGTLLSTTDSPIPIYGNLDGTTWRISTLATMIIANSNCSDMYSGYYNIISIDFGNGFNTSNVTDVSNMFSFCESLTSLDVSNFNTSHVTNMNSMFNYCRSITSLDVSNFNTSLVTNMGGMFSDCSSITSLDVSNFNTLHVTNMNGMFYNCSSITSLDVSNFNTSHVTNMNGMFYNCSSITSLDVSNFNTSHVTDMNGMFYNCSSVTGLDVSNFNTSLVTNMGGMFSGCSSITSLDVSNFNTSHVIDMGGDLDSYIYNDYVGGMFSNCSSLTSLDLSNFNTSRVINMQYMFYGCSSLTSLDLSNFDMNHLGYDDPNFEEVTYTGKEDMCYHLSITSGACTIICPLAVQTELQSGTSLPTSGVTFTWVRPTSK